MSSLFKTILFWQYYNVKGTYPGRASYDARIVYDTIARITSQADARIENTCLDPTTNFLVKDDANLNAVRRIIYKLEFQTLSSGMKIVSLSRFSDD